jgi:type II pantothenate kinase
VDETRLQAEGVRWLLKEQGLTHEEFLVVSVGTGTSYTVYSGGKTEKLPFGNPLGGGFIAGLARGAPLWVVADLVAKGGGDSLDLLYKHVFPDKAGSLEGEFVISHFARKVEKRSAEQYYTSVLNTVAVAVARDLLMYRAMRQLPQQVVFVGTCVNEMLPLALMLQMYAGGLGFVPVVPANGQYSAAIGALLEVEV